MCLLRWENILNILKYLFQFCFGISASSLNYVNLIYQVNSTVVHFFQEIPKNLHMLCRPSLPWAMDGIIQEIVIIIKEVSLKMRNGWNSHKYFLVKIVVTGKASGGHQAPLCPLCGQHWKPIAYFQGLNISEKNIIRIQRIMASLLNSNSSLQPTFMIYGHLCPSYREGRGLVASNNHTRRFGSCSCSCSCSYSCGCSCTSCITCKAEAQVCVHALNPDRWSLGVGRANFGQLCCIPW